MKEEFLCPELYAVLMSLKYVDSRKDTYLIS